MTLAAHLGVQGVPAASLRNCIDAVPLRLHRLCRQKGRPTDRAEGDGDREKSGSGYQLTLHTGEFVVTHACGSLRPSATMVSTPLMPGRFKSISVTSGWCTSESVSASSPLDGAAT